MARRRSCQEGVAGVSHDDSDDDDDDNDDDDDDNDDDKKSAAKHLGSDLFFFGKTDDIGSQQKQRYARCVF